MAAIKDSFLLLLFIISFGCSDISSIKESNIIFEKLEADYTGVYFSNQIRSDIYSKNNIFDFDYFYNGAGVATVDINNDGLLDLVFTANQDSNRIYLNLGKLRFLDITQTAGLNVGKGWSTGVSFGDVNNDGWQDIYISQGGPYHGAKSRNLLFINQKNLTFKEEAGDYGLADESISSQSAFFDFDKDGDLDCIVINENLLYGTDPKRFYQFIANSEELAKHGSNHLYINDQGVFKDITEKAGVLAPSFGLGLVVSDINDDGWLDFYVANDYYVPDMMFINKHDGTFVDKIEEYTNQISFFGMGVDIEDLNSDTYQDILVLDMASTDHYRSKTLMASMNVDAFDLLVNDLGLHHQYMFNSLHLNAGEGYYKNVAHLSNLAKSDWSWSVLINDFDNNKTNDVFITNGYKKYALNNDVRAEVLAARIKYNNKVPLRIKESIYEKMPSEKLPNLIFENRGSLNFASKASEWGIADSSFSNGAAYADLDNDGDLDIIINNIDEKAFIYQNLTTENKLGNFLVLKFKDYSSSSFVKATLYAENYIQRKESKSVRGYLSSMDYSIHFGLGKIESIDSIIIQWPSGVVEVKRNLEVNHEIYISEGEATKPMKNPLERNYSIDLIEASKVGIDFRHIENTFDDFEIETLLPYKQSQTGPSISVGDINNDGLDDFYIGGAIGQHGMLFVQTTAGTFFNEATESMKLDLFSEDMESIFFDVDNDGDKDLYVVSGGYEFPIGDIHYRDRLYINNGLGKYQLALDSTINQNRYSGKAVGVIDYDSDGLKDLIVGTRLIPGQYPVSEQSILYKNTGNQMIDLTSSVIPDLLNFGMVNDILPTDFNQDGLQDLIIVGEWTSIGFFLNKGGYFENISKEIGTEQKKGWWFNITELDLNGDGWPDYVIGNLGLNSKYKASSSEPLKLYAKDFDINGTWDVVFSNKYKEEYVPLRGRECSSNQMPFIAQEFPSYDLFAKATLDDVYGDRLKGSEEFEVTHFESLLFLNDGKGNFNTTALPIEAQFSPILDCSVIDINKDGFDDIITIGTIYETEVETPRLDMGSGTIFLSNGIDNLVFDVELNRQIRLDGNLKSIEKIKIKNEEHLIVGRNNDAPLLLKVTKN